MLFTPGHYGNQTMHSTPLPNSNRFRPDSDRLFNGLGSLLASSTNNSFCHSSLSDEGYASLQSILTPTELMQRIPSYMRHNHTLSNHQGNVINKPLAELARDSYHNNLRPMDSIFNGQISRSDENPFSRDCINPAHRPSFLHPNSRLTPSGVENEKHYSPEVQQQISHIWEPIIYQAFVSKLNTAFGNTGSSMNPFQEHKVTYVNSSKSAFQPSTRDHSLFSIDSLTQPHLTHKPILVQVRQEMIRLIDSIIQQLDSYFGQNPLSEIVSNKMQTDSETVPLNLKSPPSLFSNLNKIYSTKGDKESESLAVESDRVVNSGTKVNSNLEQLGNPNCPPNCLQKFSPRKLSHTLGSVRRFKRYGSSLRSSKSRRLRIRQITKGYLQEQAKMMIGQGSGDSSLNDSLDLRIHKQSSEMDRLTPGPNGLGQSTECKRLNEDSTSKIEKFVRQAKAAGLTKPEQIDLVRNPELIQSMKLHFNKGEEIPTPKEFINAIHTAVQEFGEAILNGQDMNPTWRKAIYKKICLLDVIFPAFFKQI